MLAIAGEATIYRPSCSLPRIAKRPIVPKNAPLYEQDFVRWTEAQAANLRQAGAARANLPLDWDNLAEEVESLGRSQRRELRSRIAVVIEHLLKLARSPAEEPRAGWIETIARERAEIERLLEDSPSLRGELRA